MPGLTVSRRAFVGIAGLGVLGAAVPARLAFARVASDRRFVFIIQRGAADGLNTVIPYAEPSYAASRGALAIDPGQAIRLDGTFALHPSLPGIAELFRQGEVTFVHAIASSYRERSHFDGQNILETGASAPYGRRDGWLNRLVSLVPSDGPGAVAIAPNLPLALRGDAAATTYAPSRYHETMGDLTTRIEDLYAGDPELSAAWSAAMAAREIAEGAQGDADSVALGQLAAGFLARPEGPRIAMLELDGWDTHSRQSHLLARRLTQLDKLVTALRGGLGQTWQETVVVVATEFGRTAAVNGTGGTDHGTGSVAMLMGGAVRGGQILADWPGLRKQDLYQERDLYPSSSLEALIAGASAETFGLDPEEVSRRLYDQARPMTGLIV